MSVTDSISPRSIAIALALMAVIGAGAAIAAPPSVDTSTSDNTSSTSDVTDGYTFNLSDTTTEQTLQYVADSNNSKVEIVTSVDGENETVYTNTTPTQVAWDSTNNDGNFNVSIADAALEDVPSAVNGNTSVTIKITNNTSAATPDVTNVSGYVERDGNRSVVMVGSATPGANDAVTVNNDTGREVLGMTVPFTADDNSAVEFERNVSSNTDEVVVILADTDANDDFSNEFSGLDSASAHSTFSALGGDGVTAQTDDEFVKVYKNDLPTDLDADTAAVTYETVGGQDALVFDVSESEDTATVSAETGVGASGYLNAYTLGGAFGSMIGVIGLLGAVRHKRGSL